MQKLNALITGASEGLGKSFALELAGRNMNLILVSLPGTELPELAAYLERNYDITVHFFEMNLTDTEACIQLFQSLHQRNIQVDILINNAGLGNWSWFEEKSIQFYKTQIELNVVTPVLLTRMFLQQVSLQTDSYILNVGSIGGMFVVLKKTSVWRYQSLHQLFYQ